MRQMALNPASSAATDEHLGDVPASLVELEPEGAGGGLSDLFHAIGGGGGENHEGAGHPRAAGGGKLAVGVGVLVHSGWGGHDREADGLAEEGRGEGALGDIPEKARAEGQVFEGGAVAAGGYFVHGAGVDEVPDGAGEDLLGAGFIVVEIDGVHAHGRLRWQVSADGPPRGAWMGGGKGATYSNRGGWRWQGGRRALEFLLGEIGGLLVMGEAGTFRSLSIPFISSHSCWVLPGRLAGLVRLGAGRYF